MEIGNEKFILERCESRNNEANDETDNEEKSKKKDKRVFEFSGLRSVNIINSTSFNMC